MAYPVKNKERHDFYYSVENPAITYNDFIQRCRNNKDKLDRELMEKIIMIPRSTYSFKIDDKWRECSHCKKYKIWKNFYKNENQSYWYNSRCYECYKEKTEIQAEKIVYSKTSKYVSPFKVRPRKWQMLSVKDIAIMEWIDKKYCPNIRQLLYLWRDIEKVMEKYKHK